MGLIYVLIIVLHTTSAAALPVIHSQEFSSKGSCEAAKEVLRESTSMKVDVLKCVQK